MEASVQVRVDVGGIDGKPHTFLAVTNPDGTTIEYGLVPKDGSPYGEGEIAITGLGTEDGEHEYQSSISGDVQPLTTEQYNNLMDFINPAIANPPDYFLLGNSWLPWLSADNCTGWANDALRAAGVSGLDGIGPRLFTSPYFQAMFFGFGDLMDSIRNQFRRGESWDTPIILDLDGDGVETTGVKEGAYFDHGGDGFAEQTGWVGSDDGLLVMDRDGDGLIESGSELFGGNTLLADGTRAANGFEALEELDSNLDGKIDGQDAAFFNLRVWKDADGNGYTTEGELLTLAEAGVQAINTGYTSSTAVDADGNAHKLTGTYTTDDGQTRSATDVWFKTDAMYTIATEWLEVPADIAALPNLQGYGQVYDLHQAMVRDASGALKDLLSRFAIATTTEERETLIPQIIYKWAGVDGIDPESRGIYIGDARMLASLEAFLGESFYQYNAVGNFNWDFSNPFWKASDEIRTAFSMFAEQVYGQLVAQTSQKPLFDQITYTWDEASQSIRGDLTAVATALTEAITADHAAGVAQLTEFARSIRATGASVMLNTTVFVNALSPLGSDVVVALGYMTGTAPAIDWTGGITRTGTYNQGGWGLFVSGTANDDTLIASTGSDAVTGLEGNDTLTGGLGNDNLNGGAGDDTYVFNSGDGQDVISDAAGTDTLLFGEGIAPSDVQVSRSNDNLILTVGNKAANGFAALAEFDENHDGRIDEKDAVYADLRVWRDVNANGMSEAGELLTLAEAGVSRLNLANTYSTTIDAQGNAHRQLGSYVDANGNTRAMTDVWFDIDPTRTRPETEIPIPEEIAALPEALGSGNVRSLRETMALDTSGKLRDEEQRRAA